MAIESTPTFLPKFEPEDFRDFDNSKHVKAFNALQDYADSLTEDQIVGQIIRWQVADGYAYYMVVDDDPLTVSSIPFLDGWQVDPIMIKGLDADDVREKVRQRRAMQNFFKSKQADT